MKQEVIDKLTELAELDLFPAVQQRSNEFFELVPAMVAADFAELASARVGPTVFFQVGAIFAAVEAQGTQIVNEVTRLTDLIRGHVASLQRCAETPKRMAEISKSWRAQATRVGDMIERAERLSQQPTWKGQASEAHLAVVPKQITAMQELKQMAETAAESVLVVGAIQSNIFDAVGLTFTQAMEQLRAHVSTAPAAYFSRAAGAVSLLTSAERYIASWLSGEGTWSPSAEQIADGLSKTSDGGFEWPKAVKSPTSTKPGDKTKDGGWETTVTDEGVTVKGAKPPTEEAATKPSDQTSGEKQTGANGAEAPGQQKKQDGADSSGGESPILSAVDAAKALMGSIGEAVGFGGVNADDVARGVDATQTPTPAPTTPWPTTVAPTPQAEPPTTVAPTPVPDPPAATDPPLQAEQGTPVGVGQDSPDTTFDRDEVSYNPDDLVDGDVGRGRTAWDRLNATRVLR